MIRMISDGKVLPSRERNVAERHVELPGSPRGRLSVLRSSHQDPEGFANGFRSSGPSGRFSERITSRLCLAFGFPGLRLLGDPHFYKAVNGTARTQVHMHR
jgi:hypothetical protein